MRLLILLQILLAFLKISKSEDEPNTTIILNDSQTEVSVEQVKNQSGSSRNELFHGLKEIESDGNDLDFNYDDEEDSLAEGIKIPQTKEQEMQEILLKAMRKPAIRKQIGEVIPILRVMTPAQRLTLAALVSSQIMSQNTLNEENLTEMATVLGNKNTKNPNDRHNITEHLLLPISMDIAKIFKGLGREMGRNLRQNFYRSADFVPTYSLERRDERKPSFGRQDLLNRRMDVSHYEFDEPSPLVKPTAEELKQPGKDECDYFTKSLCLEVSNYPTEAIMLSLRKNQEVAKTFLTDFQIPPGDESGLNPINGRKFERRKDNKNGVQDFSSDNGYMCPSSVKYARPKRARTTQGQWKYIVNAGDYTQTLRLEICQKPKSPCSYVTNHLNSQCFQIYNYHRLLTWDESKGLHMDIFKVPSCCSCHVQGYSNFYPPNKDFTFAEKRKEPLEGADLIPESQNRPPYGYLGNKREVPKNIQGSNSLTVSTNNQTQRINNKDFYKNPVDHLVPPGPPLPLENEGVFNYYEELKYNQKKITLEPNRRYPSQAEYRKTTNKLGEGVDSYKGLPLNVRSKASVPLVPEPSNIKYAKPHRPEVIPGEPQQQIFESNLFLNPSLDTPTSFPKFEVVQDNSDDVAVFITPAPTKDLLYSLGSKVNIKQPQFFKPELVDNKSVPSKLSPSFVTLSKVKGLESRISTTSAPPQKPELFTSLGQKKINYNYHPIIDFFLYDNKKKQPTYSNLQHSPLMSQDWTPVLGNN